MVGLSVAEKIKAIKNRIAIACEKSRFHQKAVTLVAVSKFQSAEKMREAILAEQNIFAENYVQEGLVKQVGLLDETIEWHFIGNIQKNKIKNMVGNFSLIQSVDDLEQIAKIGEVAREKSLGQKILLEVNIAGESSKSGIPLKEVMGFYRKSLEVSNVVVCGLMCMPPLNVSEEVLRNHFANMKLIFDEINLDLGSENFKILSMGTSADFEIAIAEGSTMVRVGTEIFGPREAK